MRIDKFGPTGHQIDQNYKKALINMFYGLYVIKLPSCLAITAGDVQPSCSFERREEFLSHLSKINIIILSHWHYRHNCSEVLVAYLLVAVFLWSTHLNNCLGVTFPSFKTLTFDSIYLINNHCSNRKLVWWPSAMALVFVKLKSWSKNSKSLAIKMTYDFLPITMVLVTIQVCK